MASRYGKLAFYSGTLAAVAGIWVVRELRSSELPPLWALALCVSASLFVFHFGVRAPHVGLISMERVPQMGLLLAFSPRRSCNDLRHRLAAMAAAESQV